MTLTEGDVEAIARRTAELLLELQTIQPSELVDAATVAAKLGISKTAVWRNARQLGGIQIGEGPRPRWRFDLQTALHAHREPQAPLAAQRPRRRPVQTSVPLLPIRS